MNTCLDCRHPISVNLLRCKPCRLVWNKQELIDTYTKPQEYDPSVLGSFLPHDIGYRTFADLDGTHARAFLESMGFDVVKNVDTGHNGWAITADGYRLSTNGWFCKTGGENNKK